MRASGLIPLARFSLGRIIMRFILTCRLLCLVAVTLALGAVARGDDAITKVPPIALGPFRPTFESLKQYQVPEWFMDAKLGIFMHWGPCAVGGTHGWYGREMYRQGSPTYKFHVATFGHPSKFGYKDICKLFKAEQFDDVQADTLVKLYKKAGRRYIVPVAVHHDNFDMWDSKYQPRWNAKLTTGKDIIGMWKKAAEANGMRFGVASHVARTYRWFQTSHGADADGPLKGIPYDGQDRQYADLYGVPWKQSGTYYEQYSDVGPAEWERQFELRMRDLMDRYQPDVYYVDGGIPFHVHPAGLNVMAHYYNASIAHHGGKLEAVAAIKLDWQPTNAVLDFEFATKGGMPDYYWQSDKSINHEWFWMRTDKPEEYTPADRIIATLMDNISRKGNLLLNLPLKPDGTFDPAVIRILEEMGRCTGTIGEAIYATRAWEVYGEGPTDFNKNFPAGTARDIRFTRNKLGSILYATVLGWPGNGATLTITTLKASRFDAGAIASVRMLGSPGELAWNQNEAGLNVVMPATAPGRTRTRSQSRSRHHPSRSCNKGNSI